METNNEQREGYNLRGRFNLYAGLVVGALLPIVAARYTIFNDSPEGALGEVLAWSGAACANLLFAPAGALAGLAVGKMIAEDLCKGRLARQEESKLKDI